jgi:hypothetical protein
MAVGKQTADHILFPETEDLQHDYTEMDAKGVNFLTHPEERTKGKDAIFEDINGNIIYLVQRPKMPQTRTPFTHSKTHLKDGEYKS